MDEISLNPQLSRDSQVEDELREVLSDTWRKIQEKNFHSGQPRSHDTVEAVSMCKSAVALASRTNYTCHTAEACRMLAYTLSANEQYVDSILYYRAALGLLEGLGASLPAARMRLGFIEALSAIGSYGEALQEAEVAKWWFTKSEDDSGLARLYTNVGNF